MNRGLLELLVDLYEVDEIIAKKQAKRLKSEDFYSAVDTLEQTLGYDIASQIISRGRVLSHIAVDFDDYMNMVREVSGKLGYVGPLEVPLFDSIESLKKYTHDSSERVNISKIDLAKYRLFHEDNEQSKKYLSELIDEGEVSCGISEHWAKKNKSNGVRGCAIAKKIGHEINRLFDDLGLSRPRFNINYGQRSIEIDDDTADVLRQVRDAIYNSD